MPESLKKIQPWMVQILIWVVTLIFLAGGAYREFAPREWVQEKIQDHATKSEQSYREDMREIKDALKRIEDRQYEAAQQGKGK